MVKRPSFPVYRVAEQRTRRSFDHRLTAVAFFLAVAVAGALLAKAVGPIPATPSDPNTYLIGP